MISPEDLVRHLGGLDNIVELESCVTRLRAEVERPELVDSTQLRRAGAHGVTQIGTMVQVVVGPNADTLVTEITIDGWVHSPSSPDIFDLTLGID